MFSNIERTRHNAALDILPQHTLITNVKTIKLNARRQKMKKSVKLSLVLISIALICASLIIAVSASGSTPNVASYINDSGETVNADLASAIANGTFNTRANV